LSTSNISTVEVSKTNISATNLSAETEFPLKHQSLDAKFLSQLISMGPFVFQTARCLKKYRFLSLIFKKNNEGASLFEIQQSSQLSTYSIEVLLDAGISCKLIYFENQKYYLTQVGYYIQFDEITKTNMNFSHDVCYKGLFDLDGSLEKNSPEGLKTFGNWTTIYEGLTSLPSDVLESWFNFDHLYSDGAFPRALPYVFETNPKNIMDIGGNTGKFAMTCSKAQAQVKVTLVDHPKQVELAKNNVKNAGLESQIDFFACDILDESSELPKGYDIIWMSQFLDCFSEDQIVYLLNKVKKSLNPQGSILIMETFTDNQRFDSAKFCLDMTSLYFTVMANGKSRMYPLNRFSQLIERAGLKIDASYEGIKLFHTILRCL
jgi:ubiquinone/menaquinone biosynthesis C-methylase UbiE